MRKAMSPMPPQPAKLTMLRVVSLMMAVVVSATIVIYPKALGQVSHGQLMLVMLGISAGFVHGVGFTPEHKAWRVLFSPRLAWPLMGLGLWLLFLN